MTDQHRATPEQWAKCEEDARLWSGAFNCILELRARVRVLEATQHAHADLSRLSDAEREAMAQEMAKPAALRPLKVETIYGSKAAADAAQILRPPVVVEGTFEHGGETYRYKANATPERESATDELRAPTTEARPGGLVERVADVFISKPFTAGDPVGARAAIREVAAWLRQNDAKCQMGGDAAATADLLEQEADRG